jgi:hypothetical protein
MEHADFHNVSFHLTQDQLAFCFRLNLRRPRLQGKTIADEDNWAAGLLHRPGPHLQTRKQKKEANKGSTMIKSLTV